MECTNHHHQKEIRITILILVIFFLFAFTSWHHHRFPDESTHFEIKMKRKSNIDDCQTVKLLKYLLLVTALCVIIQSIIKSTSSWNSGGNTVQKIGRIQEYRNNNNTNTNIGSWWVRPDKIIGHIHMAKTGGTELNGMLASNFERVCGHKGYSHDYYQYNERVRNTVNETNPSKWVRGK